MTELYALLISLVPVLLAVMFARRYNFLHGLIAYIVMSYVYCFCLDQFGIKGELSTFILKFSASPVAIYSYINGQILKIDFLAELLAKNPNLVKYILLAVVLLVFVIFQVIASSIRRSRKRRAKSLVKQAKRY